MAAFGPQADCLALLGICQKVESITPARGDIVAVYHRDEVEAALNRRNKGPEKVDSNNAERPESGRKVSGD